MTQLKNSTEVGYLKNLIVRDHQKAFNSFDLKFEGKKLIDPMSFVDHAGVAGRATITVAVVPK